MSPCMVMVSLYTIPTVSEEVQWSKTTGPWATFGPQTPHILFIAVGFLGIVPAVKTNIMQYLYQR